MGPRPQGGWVWDVELTCECGLGCGLLAPWDLDLGVVTSGDGCVLNSVAVDGRLAVLPFQGDTVVCLGDAAKIPGSIQACLGEEGTFVWKTSGTKRVAVPQLKLRYERFLPLEENDKLAPSPSQ